jgi:lipoyl(octanoyl) transferase
MWVMVQNHHIYVRYTPMHIIRLPGLTPYANALAAQEAAVAEVLAGGSDRVFVVEHPPVFTVGTGGNAAAEVLAAGEIEVVQTGRGGKTTYHGPGQLVVYPVVDLARLNKKDLKAYIATLQSAVVAALAELGVTAHARGGDELGVWVATPAGEAKIAAFGVRVRRWVAFHGLALNVNPNLEHFTRIKPCGLNKPAGSLHALGVKAGLNDVAAVVVKQLQRALTA